MQKNISIVTGATGGFPEKAGWVNHGSFQEKR